MARPLRIELSGGLYHVTGRGDRREDIYFGAPDRERWLQLLGQVCDRFNGVCHAFCQMTNHYHLVVEAPEGNLAPGMRQLNGVYTQHVNRTHRRVGHVFQGRYQAILVEKDRYLLELARYVVLNPVRARMVNDPADWPWSSHRIMLGGQAPGWLQTDWIVGQFGSERRRAVARYVDFVRSGVGLPPLWEKLQNQIYLGSEQFVERLQREIDTPHTLSEVPRAQRRPVAKPLAYYADRHADAALAMAMAFRSGDYTLKAIGDYFGVHYTTVSRAVRTYETSSKQTPNSDNPGEVR